MATEGMPVLTGVLREQRRSLLIWSGALFTVAAFYISFYPSIGATPAMQEMIDSMPQGVAQALGYDQITSAAGYIGATVYGLLGPVLMLVFAIGAGARLIAGEEEAGSLELELAHPVSRMRLAGERWLAVAVDVCLLTLPVLAASLLLITALDLDVQLGNLVAMSAGLLLFAMAFGSVAFAIGAATGRRAAALGGTAALAVLAYIAHAIGPQLQGGAWMDEVSPFGWYLSEDPLINGWDFAGLGLLAAVVAVAVPLALVTFSNRDFGT
ncbi:MAG TPA: ABC transporter permease subunit [Actinomycetota bacterium]|nr:ABC transporter permease subunit [Actinomycetota bacterium]